MNHNFNPKKISVGDTPVENIYLPIDNYDLVVQIKREDLNPTGSFKDRSILPWLQHYLRKGDREFVISSTGNSAISTVYWLDQLSLGSTHDVQLDVFISDKLNEAKLVRLKDYIDRTRLNSKFKVNVNYSKNPKSEAIKYSKNHGSINLRSSTDDIAIAGYESLGYEISHLDLSDIFMITSSGTSLVGIYRGLASNKQSHNLPRIHTFQVPQACGLYQNLRNNFDIELPDTEKINCISDKIALRIDDVESILRDNDGTIDLITDQDFELLKNIDLHDLTDYPNISSNSLASLVGMLKYIRAINQIELERFKPLVIFTGR